MTTMQSEVYKVFRSLNGVSDDQAIDAATALAAAHDSDISTIRNDISDVKSDIGDIKIDIVSIKSAIGNVRVLYGILLALCLVNFAVTMSMAIK